MPLQGKRGLSLTQERRIQPTAPDGEEVWGKVSENKLVAVFGVEEAQKELSEWEFGYDLKTKAGAALHEVAIEGARTVIEEIGRCDSVVLWPGGDPTISLGPLGGDFPEITINLRMLLEKELQIIDEDGEEGTEFAAFLREFAAKFEGG